MQAEPQKQHHWLKRLIGEWKYESEFEMEPGGPKKKMSGTETFRSIGDIWVIGEGNFQMPDGTQGHTLLTLGFDPARKHFVGSWVGSMMTYFWVYQGTLDEAKNELTLDCEGPRFDESGQMTRYKDIHRLVSDNERILSSHVLGSDGTWSQMMSITHHRVK